MRRINFIFKSSFSLLYWLKVTSKLNYLNKRECDLWLFHMTFDTAAMWKIDKWSHFNWMIEGRKETTIISSLWSWKINCESLHKTPLNIPLNNCLSLTKKDSLSHKSIVIDSQLLNLSLPRNTLSLFFAILVLLINSKNTQFMELFIIQSAAQLIKKSTCLWEKKINSLRFDSRCKATSL